MRGLRPHAATLARVSLLVQPCSKFFRGKRGATAEGGDKSIILLQRFFPDSTIPQSLLWLTRNLLHEKFTQTL